MTRFAADENVNAIIVRALRHRLPGLDHVFVQHAGLTETPDRDVLAWAAQRGRVLLTQDRSTMIAFAFDRVAVGRPMPGLCVVRDDISIGRLIDDLEIAIRVYEVSDWQNQAICIPM